MDIKDVASKVLNLPEVEAIEIILSAGLKVRVLERDGQRFMHTREARSNRINLLIKDGIVFETTLG